MYYMLQISDNVMVLRQRIPLSVALRDPPTLEVNILVVDNGFPSQTATASFNLTVTNIDEDLLPDITLSTKKVMENTTIGEPVAEIILHMMSENFEDFDFHMLHNSYGKFGIDKSQVLLMDQLDYFASPSHQIVLQAQHRHKPEMVIQDTFTLLVLATNPCGKTCDVGGKCIAFPDGSYGCVCRPGFSGTGTFCENINDCIVIDNNNIAHPGNPCYHGDCVDQVNSYLCHCYPGFTGPSCATMENNGNPCTGNHTICENGGVCIPGGDNGYTCSCLKGWTGITCETSVNECEDHHCFVDAPCVDIHNTYFCQCPHKRVGARCEFYLSSCIVDLCHIWEMCIPHYNDAGYYCVDLEKETKIKFSPDIVENDKTFTVLFYDFFYNYVIFSDKPGESSSSDGIRVRRSLLNESSVYMYIQDLEHDDDELVMSLYVMTKEGEVYEPVQALKALMATCERISK